MVSYFDADGTVAAPDELRITKSRDLALVLRDGRVEFASLVECRAEGESEWVVFDIDVEVPQVPVHPILPEERVAVRFSAEDTAAPLVLAMRRDFPRVPHLNLHIMEYPRSLCLYDERYEETKASWTAPRLVHRVREWMALTARGKLHDADQPLEPFLGDFAGHLVLPLALRDSAAAAPERLHVTARPKSKAGRHFLVAEADVPAGGDGFGMVVSSHQAPPHTHGVIQRRPRTLGELAEMLRATGLDLIADLQGRLREWFGEDKSSLESRLLLVIRVPLRRDAAAAPERLETWAFLLEAAPADGEGAGDGRVRALGQHLGLWEAAGDEVGLALPPYSLSEDSDIFVDVLNVTFELGRELAAHSNGDDGPSDISIAAIGVGALGSQVAMHGARRGYGRWTLIDHDTFMPHNAARHALDGNLVGANKAEAVAFCANAMTSESPFKALPVDVLTPGTNRDELLTSLGEAECLLDMSTSLAVARTLACDVEAQGRRASLFLTPSGSDLVLIAEDRARRLRLDALEMQYYRAVLNNASLEGHFEHDEQRHRYGQSCRDISATLPNHLVSLHAAIAAGCLPNVLEQADAAVAVWRAAPDGNVTRVDIPVEPVILQQLGPWTVIADEGLLAKLSALRHDKLPNETGGVLLGSFDLERSIVYLADALPSPPDSEEWPTLYIRGSEGLREAVDQAHATTQGMVEYVGEWHSHPTNASTAASNDDLQVFAWLTSMMEAEGLPAVMMIVGDPGRRSCFVGEIKKDESLLELVSP